MNNVWVKFGVSLVAAILIAARLYWPDIKIDAITIGLFSVGLIPWLTSIIESLKTPGGWEIKLRDVSAAGEKITGTTHFVANRSTRPFQLFDVQDPNLALVALRIEIEKRLRKLAELRYLEATGPLSKILQSLLKNEALDQSKLSGLQEIIMAGNQAAHGAKVEPSLSEWAFSNGSDILQTLDSILANHKQD